MLRIMLNAAFTVLAKENKGNVTVTLDSMTNCFQKRGVIILNSRSGSVYIRYSRGEHNLTIPYRSLCKLFISAPSGMHLYIEILPERASCMFSVIVRDLVNGAELSYCYVTTEEYMRTSKMLLMGDLVQLDVGKEFRLFKPFAFHLRFQAVQPSYELQVHYDSPKHCK